MRRRALPDATLVLVEGVSDKRALFPFLDADTVVLPTDGKDQLILAFRELEPALRVGVLFLLDCDGDVDPSLKGHSELVLTTNRDMEADLLFELDALTRVAQEYVAPKAINPADASRTAADIFERAVVVSMTYGICHRLACEQSLPTRVIDARTGKRRRLQLGDLGGLAGWLARGHDPSVAEVVGEMAKSLNWSDVDRETVATRAAEREKEECARHAQPSCHGCNRMTHCNGHVLVEALSQVLGERHGIHVDVATLATAIRLAADSSRVANWSVARRIRKWEADAGYRVLAV